MFLKILLIWVKDDYLYICRNAKRIVSESKILLITLCATWSNNGIYQVTKQSWMCIVNSFSPVSSRISVLGDFWHEQKRMRRAWCWTDSALLRQSGCDFDGTLLGAGCVIAADLGSETPHQSDREDTAVRHLSPDGFTALDWPWTREDVWVFLR